MLGGKRIPGRYLTFSLSSLISCVSLIGCECFDKSYLGCDGGSEYVSSNTHLFHGAAYVSETKSYYNHPGIQRNSHLHLLLKQIGIVFCILCYNFCNCTPPTRSPSSVGILDIKHSFRATHQFPLPTIATLCFFCATIPLLLFPTVATVFNPLCPAILPL